MTFEEKIARVCHEANRGLQAAWPADGVPVAVPWDEETPEQRASVVAGVEAILREDLSPEESHERWCDYKRREGWAFGPVKDSVAKLHPCLVPYSALPPENRVKDALFGAIVRALSPPRVPRPQHPATAALLRYFDYDHLPRPLQAVSRPFAELACHVIASGEGPEATVALRKLLEAKDCAVRAALPPREPEEREPTDDELANRPGVEGGIPYREPAALHRHDERL